ncbi:hypothetical protein HZH68_010540 [Vespula germanica]|uniref:Uncharacterized protein n=1 Tax=Vespula germanica TaxID=30212 RepID=A0A834JY16_VESGE|nr:hypothetical protein HZH68_010540 [Vespula germanica]
MLFLWSKEPAADPRASPWFAWFATATVKKTDGDCVTERKNFVSGNEANEDNNDDDDGDGNDDSDGDGENDDDSENETTTVAIKTASRYFARSILSPAATTRTQLQGYNRHQDSETFNEVVMVVVGFRSNGDDACDQRFWTLGCLDRLQIDKPLVRLRGLGHERVAR